MVVHRQWYASAVVANALITRETSHGIPCFAFWRAGFLFTALSLTVPAYYGSLSIAAYMGIANQFEEKYRWVETPIHLVAWCVPLALFMYPAFTGGFNPNGAGCALAQAPPGCDADPLVPCERGNDIGNFRLIVGLGLVLLYFVFPPSIMGATYFWLKKTRKKLEASQETDQSRVHARNQIMQQVANQIYLYLFSFWSTIVPTLVSVGQQILMGEILYSLLIISNCIYALQGFVMAIVYFTLENRGTPVDSLPSPRVEDGHNSARGVRHSEATPPKCQQPEQNIPPDADNGGDAAAPPPPPEDPRAASDDAGAAAAATARLHFNIFDVEEDGPWAEFFREEEEDELPPELPPQLRWRPEEGDADKNLDLRTKLYLYENVLRI